MVKTFSSIIVVLLLLALAGVLFFMPVMAADISVTSDRNPVGLDESFRLIYETSDSVDDDPDFSPLEEYVEILNRSQSSKINIINGDYQSSKTWTLNVMAKIPGEINLPPVSFGSDTSAGLKITVKKSKPVDKASADFFTQLESSHDQVSVQQQFIITQKLFTAKNLSAYSMGDLSIQGNEALIEELGNEKQYKTRIGDRAFLVVEKKFAVFPQKSGELNIAPVMAEARLTTANSFFGGFSEGKLMRARSNALNIKVTAVPPNTDIIPWLPASEFELLEQWPSKSVKFIQGEPVTRTISMKGVGLTSAQLPVIPAIEIEGIKQYPDQPLMNNVANDNGITGYRVEKVAFIPTRAGQLELPAIEIPWWNTQTGKREVARIPAQTIEVKAAPGNSQQAPLKNGSVNIEKNETQVAPAPVINSMQGVGHESEFWRFTSLLLALGWALSMLFWFYYFRKRTVSHETSNPYEPQSESTSYRQFIAACNQRNAKLCKQHLIQWAQQHYTQQGDKTWPDIKRYLPQKIRQELNKIDALLYGGQQESIDYELLRQQVDILIKQSTTHKSTSYPVLEPMYKI